MVVGGAIRKTSTAYYHELPSAFVQGPPVTRCVPAGIKLLRNVMITWVLHSKKVCLMRMWKEFEPIYREIRRKKNRAARFWLNKNIKECWSKWYGDYLDELEVRREREKHKHLARAIMRMQNLKLTQGLNRWYQWYLDLMRQIAVLKGSIVRMKKRKISMAWEKWQEWYAEMKDQLSKLKKGAASYRIIHARDEKVHNNRIKAF